VLGFDWDELPTDRDPTVVEYKDFGIKYSANWTTGGYFGAFASDDDFDVDIETEMLQDAIYDAMAGLYADLLELIAAEAYPEDPEMALKFLNRRMLSDEVLEEAMRMSFTHDAGSVLLTLFDACHTNA
jgi:hypothetical protein